MGEKCTVREALTAKRVSSTACGAPVRDRSRRPRIVYWLLFALSTLFIGFRFLSRSSSYGKGPGYGLDDWTMLIVLLFLTLQQVGVDFSAC